jgi:hypothetical protein
MLLWILLAPFVWLYEAIVQLAPIIGVGIAVVCIIAAVLSVVVIVVAARTLARAQRRWVRIIGRIIIALEIIATLAFAGVAAIAVAAVSLYA